MVFDELEKTLNVNRNRIINPGVPYLENAEEAEDDFSCFKFEIVRYGTDETGIRRRYVEATIDVTNYMEDALYNEKVPWNVDVMQELLRRVANMHYAGIMFDPDVIDKFLDYDSAEANDCYIDDDGLAHFNTEELDIMDEIMSN